MVEVFRVRVTPEVGYWEACGLLVLAPPGQNGICLCYRHERRDLKREKADELAEKIRAAGQINPSNGWHQEGSVPYENLVDK